MNLGEKIYTLRTQSNMSQSDLAHKIDVSRQSISKWETETSTPDLEKLIKLSKIFKVSLDELIGNEIQFKENIEQNLMTQEQVDEIINNIAKNYKPQEEKTAAIDLIVNVFGVLLVLLGIIYFVYQAFLFGITLFIAGVISIVNKREKLLVFFWSILLSITGLFATGTSVYWWNLSVIMANFKLHGFLSIENLIASVPILAYILLSLVTILKKKGKEERLFALGWCIVIRQLAQVIGKTGALIDVFYLIVYNQESVEYGSYIFSFAKSFIALVIIIVGLKLFKNFRLKKQQGAQNIADSIQN